MRNSGSIAEAALQINKVFEAAQAAADQYVENVKQVSGRSSKNVDESVAEQANKQADKLIVDTEKERLLKKEKELFEKEQEYRYLKHFYKKYKWLADILD